MTLHVETGFDLARIGPISFTLVENNVAVGAVSLASGTHFFSFNGTTIIHPDGETGIALGYFPIIGPMGALKAEMDSIGSGTYTVAFNTVTQRLTISVTGVPHFRMDAISDAAEKVLGYTALQSNALSQIAQAAPWYRIQAAQGCLSEYFWDEEEDGSLGEDAIAQDGTAYAIAEDDCATLYDAVIPLEPRAAVWIEFAPVTAPFTWQRLFRHARNVEPVALAFQDGGISRTFFVRLRRDGRLFRPIPRNNNKNWWEYADIEIRARLLGKT